MIADFLTCAYAVATSPLVLFFLAVAVIVAVVEFAIFVRRECRRADAVIADALGPERSDEREVRRFADELEDERLFTVVESWRAEA